MRRRLGVLSLLSLLGCVHSMTGTMDRWVGQDQSTLVSRWGAPDRTADLPNGGKVLTWITRYDAGEPVERRECRRSFTVMDGKVTQWSADGCPRYYTGSPPAP